MKYMIIIFLGAMLFSCAPSSRTQITPLDVDNFDPGRFIFSARTANPAKGRLRILDHNYDVIVRNDSIISFMPYFGVSDIAPAGPDETGLRFSSTKYSMNTNRIKEGGWEITFDILDQRFVNRMTFTIFSNGSATLGVTSNFRDFIQFSGEVNSYKK